MQVLRVLAGAAALTVAVASTGSTATITSSSTAGTLAGERSQFMALARHLDLGGAPLCGTTGALATNVGTFQRGVSANGSGGSVCGDTSTVQVKNETDPVPFGRSNPPTGIGRWVDSNDLEHVDWVINTAALGIAQPITGLEFALVDAHDQRNSFFEMIVGAARFEIATREPDATVHWLTVLFDAPVSDVTLTFRTRLNDGFGIANATLAPIPAPPALILVVSGLALLGAARRRRSRTA